MCFISNSLDLTPPSAVWYSKLPHGLHFCVTLLRLFFHFYYKRWNDFQTSWLSQVLRCWPRRLSCFTVNVSEPPDHREVMDYFSQQTHTDWSLSLSAWRSGRYSNHLMWVTHCAAVLIKDTFDWLCCLVAVRKGLRAEQDSVGRRSRCPCNSAHKGSS